MIDQAQSQLEVSRRAEVAHYRLQAAMYFSKRLDLPWASLLFAEDIEDPEWNHAASLDLGPAASNGGFDPCLAEMRRHFEDRERPLTIVGGPSCCPDLEQIPWRRLGFTSSFRQVWHFFQMEPIAAVGLGSTGEIPGVDIAPVRGDEDMRAFLDVFESVYRVDLETGEPETLAPGYSRGLLRSFHQRHSDLEVVHYLATVNGRPAGVSTSVHGLAGEIRGISGLYNLAVHPDFRRRGLGGGMVRRRAADARALGQEIVFLQTERESVERRLPRHGFRRGFETEGWTQISPKDSL